MVSSAGYGTAASASPQLRQQHASVSGDATAQTAQPAATVQKPSTQRANADAAAATAQPGVNVNISPEGAAASTQAQYAQTVQTAPTADRTETATTSTDASTSADTSDSTDVARTDAHPSTVSPVKAFAYGALGLERPDQPQDERNGFYTAGKWLAAGLTIGGLISLLV
jgi:hypothetical protein